MSELRTDDTKLYQHRLLMIAKALRESPNPDMFNMGDVLHRCGTPACAFGHYVFRTDLQDFVRPQMATFEDTGREFWQPVFIANGKHASFFGLEVREHFGLTAMEQSALFDGGGCGGAVTANEAAAFIEKFVARKYPEAV